MIEMENGELVQNGCECSGDGNYGYIHDGTAICETCSDLIPDCE